MAFLSFSLSLSPRLRVGPLNDELPPSCHEKPTNDARARAKREIERERERKKSKSSVNEERKRGLELDKEKRIFSYLSAKIDAPCNLHEGGLQDGDAIRVNNVFLNSFRGVYRASSGHRVRAEAINFARETEKESIQARCGWEDEEKRKGKK